jgi:hypothetical protein
MDKKLNIRQLIDLNKKRYGIRDLKEAEDDEWTQANKFDLTQAEKDVDKTMADQGDQTPKGSTEKPETNEPPVDKNFLTAETVVLEVRKVLKSEIEKTFRCVLANPESEPAFNEDGTYNDVFRVGSYIKPNGFFESSEKTTFETTVEWDEEKQDTELTSIVVCKFLINKNEYSIPLKDINFSIANKT